MTFTTEPFTFPVGTKEDWIERELKVLNGPGPIYDSTLFVDVIKSGRSHCICGVKGMGKTSLLNNIAFSINASRRNLIAIGPLSLHQNFRFTVGDSLRGLIDKFPERIRLPADSDIPDSIEQFPALLEKVTPVANPETRFVIVLDDLDGVPDLRALTALLSPRSRILCAGDFLEDEFHSRMAPLAEGMTGYMLGAFTRHEMDEFFAMVTRKTGFRLNEQTRQVFKNWSQSVPYFSQALTLDILSQGFPRVPDWNLTPNILEKEAPKMSSLFFEQFLIDSLRPPSPWGMYGPWIEPGARERAQEVINMLLRSDGVVEARKVDWDNSVIRHLWRRGIIWRNARNHNMVWATPLLGNFFKQGGTMPWGAAGPPQRPKAQKKKAATGPKDSVKRRKFKMKGAVPYDDANEVGGRPRLLGAEVDEDDDRRIWARPKGKHEREANGGADVPETAPADDEPFRRMPHLDASVAACPPVGSEFDVEVFCDTGPAREGETSSQLILLHAPASQQEFPVEVFLSPGTALQVVGPSSQMLLLKRSEAESQRAKFRVAVESAPATAGVALNAYFFHDGRPCGRVTRVLPVGAAATPVPPAGRIEVVTGTPADLTISITRPDGSLACYRVKLSSPHLTAAELGEPALWDLGVPAQEYVTAIFANFIASRNDPANRLAALRGAGQNLFNKAPKNFKNAYERLAKAGTLKSILIVSDEPYIPWELMVPPTTREQRVQGIERDPIGVAHAVGRWISDENISPPARLRIARVMVVAPDYTNTELKPLLQSQEEARYLQRRLRAPVLSPTVYATITSALKTEPPDLFHFIGHGNSAPDAPSQCLHLEDKDSLKPDVVFGEPAFLTAFAAQKPFVFLNACEVGQQTLALGGPAGFVPTFIQLLASSIIAPLWSVRDSFAHEVAQALYDAAIPDAGPPPPVAEVLRGIRARAYHGAKAGEDSYAAYCFYGDPHFVIEATPVLTAPSPSPGT